MAPRLVVRVCLCDEAYGGGVKMSYAESELEDTAVGTWIGTQRWVRPAAGLLAVGALSTLPVLTGCADTASAAEVSLERFTSCAELSRYAQARALETIGPFGPTGGGLAPFAVIQEDSGAAPIASAGAARVEIKEAGTDFSGTNVQEAGIDEPDIVKTDGNRLFAIAKNRLFSVDVSGATPRIAGSLDLPKDVVASHLLLVGNRLVVIGTGPVSVRDDLPADGDDSSAKRLAGGSTAPYGGGAVFLEVDVTNPSAMSVTETFATEAGYVSARLSGTTARIVVNSGAPIGIAFTYPDGTTTEQAALAANRNALRRTTADNWIPRYAHRGADGRSSSGALVSCEGVSRPTRFSGLGTVTVLTMDLSQGINPIDSDSVMASGETVYASTDALYVATNRWPEFDGSGRVASEPTTDIHKFDTSDGATTSYAGSGSVEGSLLNQFSMSEHEGNLRVATTDRGESFVGGDAIVPSDGPSESFVSVLEQNGEKLTLAGRVGGLGKGETIQSVRFIGARGYVVTFKRTDPLYAIDLSDPRSPKVTGELKINGYSSYLHPVDENTLIGVGQDATDEGRVTGTQVAVFDVSDPAAPKRVQQYTLPGAYSEAEWDQYAFLYWPATKLAVLPIQTTFATPAPAPSPSPGAEPALEPQVTMQSFALGLRVSRDGISEVGRIVQPVDPQYGGGIRRSVVVDDNVLTISESGIAASALGDLASRGFVPFS